MYKTIIPCASLSEKYFLKKASGLKHLFRLVCLLDLMK